MPAVLVFSLILAILSAGESCRKVSADNMSGENIQRAQTGAWGGNHIQMDVGRDGVRLEFDCAHGAIEEPLAVGNDGRFDLKGFFVREHGGPVRADQEEKRLQARYSGRVNRKTMTLNITLTETGESLGTFTLARGKVGRLTKCL